MSDNTSGGKFIELTASIVSAYVSNNSVPASDLPALISQVHAALTRVLSGYGDAPRAPPKAAIPVKKSISPEYIVCLEDGKKFKSLKRHLRAQYNMTPEQYREKWGLPPDYPMVAESYAEMRRGLAKKIGLGRKPSAKSAAVKPAATKTAAVKPVTAKASPKPAKPKAPKRSKAAAPVAADA